MYKLVAVGGKIRGQEYNLTEGENIFGRNADCTFQITLQGISGRHLSITISGESVYLEDLGSSNGTFLNGKLVKKSSISTSDQIALPGVIFQLVHVAEKKVIVKKKVAKNKEENDESLDLGHVPPMPKSLMGKVIYLFRFKLMPVIYGFNEQYEWRSLVAILLSIFVAITIFLTIFPVLDTSKNILIQEMIKRANHYTKMIGRLNATALQRKDIDKLDTAFLENEDGVKSYELFDLDGRIVSPVEKLNKYINDPFSIWAMKEINAQNNARQYHGQIFHRGLSEGEIGVAMGITAYNVKSGVQELFGIIAIRFAPQSLASEATASSKAYLESLVVAAAVAIIFFGILYFLTIRHIDEMHLQIEESLRNKRKELDSKYVMTELNPLRNTINSLIQRVRDLQKTDMGEFNEVEEDSNYVDILSEFVVGAQGPVMVLNSEKNIQKINMEAEDLVGIRESLAIGSSLLDSARDQGFAATVTDLCDQSASHDGRAQTDVYELMGVEYNIYVTALVGKDNFAKAFYVTFVKEE